MGSVALRREGDLIEVPVSGEGVVACDARDRQGFQRVHPPKEGQKPDGSPVVHGMKGLRMKYVVGFAFTPEESRVWLIRKERPKWQRGLLNGVGGKIEDGETPLEAMVREFKEEAGLEIREWDPVVRLSILGNGAVIYFFRTFLDKGQKPSTQEDEPIRDYHVSDMQILRTIPNLHWLVPLALDNDVSGKGWIDITDVTGR